MAADNRGCPRALRSRNSRTVKLSFGPWPKQHHRWGCWQRYRGADENSGKEWYRDQRVGNKYLYFRIVCNPQSTSTNWWEGVLDGRFLPIYGPYAGPGQRPAGQTNVGYKWRGQRAGTLASTKTCYLPPSPNILGNCVTHYGLQQTQTMTLFRDVFILAISTISSSV